MLASFIHALPAKAAQHACLQKGAGMFSPANPFPDSLGRWRR